MSILTSGNRGLFFVPLGVGGAWVDAKHPKNRFFFITTVTSGVDTNGGKLAAFAPAFDCKSGNTENGSNL